MSDDQFGFLIVVAAGIWLISGVVLVGVFSAFADECVQCFHAYLKAKYPRPKERDSDTEDEDE